MNNKHQWKSCKEIEPSILVDVFIIICMNHYMWILYQQHRYKPKNSNGAKRIDYLPCIIFPLWQARLYFLIYNSVFQQQVKKYKSNTRYYKIAAADFFNKKEIVLPVHIVKFKKIEHPGSEMLNIIYNIHLLSSSSMTSSAATITTTGGSSPAAVTTSIRTSATTSIRWCRS